MDIINDIEIEVEQAVNGAVNISTNHHIPVSAFTIFGIIHKLKRERSYPQSEEGDQTKTFTCTAAGLRCSPACRGTAPSLCVRQNMNNYGL